MVFTDIVGSTTLSQHLDPEDINLVMDGALQSLAAIVGAHQGAVLQYAGDSMLAVFGAGIAREDDPERAVRAGLAILAEGRAQAALVQQRHGHTGFNLRVGIHTGAVLLGGGVDGEHSIRGMAVNIAARMEQAAPPGALRISHDTWRHVRGLFEVEEQLPLLIKGRADPMLTYLVQGVAFGVRHQALRGVEGAMAPMIGREAELALLQEAWRGLADASTQPLVAVTVVAEAGMGKSRLMAEFHRWVAQQGGRLLWLEAHASESGSGRPYGLLRELFAGLANILDSDAAPLARTKWLAGLAPLLPQPADAAVLGHLLGIDFSAEAEVRALLGDARQLRDRAFFHATQALQRMAEDATTVLLMFDDLHWADDGTLDFIDHLLRSDTGPAPLLVGVTRPTLYERRPGWGESWPRHHRADLPALGAEQSGVLADTLLRKLATVPASLRDLLTEHAEGNPFFIEELVNMLIDEGAIVATAADRWTLVPERLHGLAVPTTLTGVLQARLDTLPAAELRTLQLAAVVGHVFWDDALRALDLPAADALPTLLARELVVEHATSSLAGKREFSFRHHTLHQVSYERVLKRTRRPAHARVAQWLAAQPGPAHLDQIAEHFEQGGELAQALEYWQRAAESARSRYALAPALSHSARALALLPADDVARRWDLTYLRARVLDYAFPSDLAPALDELERLTAVLGDPARRARTLERRSRQHLDNGDTALALASAEQAMALADGIDEECMVLAQAQRFMNLGRLGRYVEARAAAPVALARARAADMPPTEAMILNEIGNYAVDVGDFEAAIEHLEQALALHRRVGNRVNESGTLANLGFVAMTLGDYASAQQLFMQALSLSAAIGQRKNEGIIRINLALILVNLGQPAAAQGHAQQALALLRAAADRWGEGAALRVAGQAAQALGDGAAAAALLAASRELFDQLGLPHLAIEAMALLATAALARGDRAEALAQVQAILQRQAAGAGLEGTDEPLRIRLACWQVLDATADARADTLLETAWQELNSRAARIGDARRREVFLAGVSFHREIARAWQTRHPGKPATGS